MRIFNTPPIRPSDKTDKKKSGSGGTVGFEKFLHADEAEASSGASAAQGANAFLFLQEISDEELYRQKGMQRGNQALDMLEALQRDLLMGQVPAATLHKLDTFLSERTESFSDPRLDQLLNEIELRVAVEKAKLDKS